MHIRPITSDELDRFAAAGPHPMGTEGFTAYIRERWASGSSKPEHCFVIEESGQITGRIAYDGGEEATYFGLWLPWSGDYLAAGECLFRESLAHLRRAGVHRLERFITSSWEYASQERALLDHFGLPLVQEKVRMTWEDAGQPLTLTGRLVYRTLDEVGEGAFAEVISRVSDGSLDRLEQLLRGTMGSDAYGREYVAALKAESEPQPEWWLLAYTPDGDLVGHVIAAPFDPDQKAGTIGYIGVVPEQRGKGYIHDLLAQGIHVMQAGGLTSIVCDTDALNHPMIRAFQRRGFRQTGSVWAYNGPLDTILS